MKSCCLGRLGIIGGVIGGLIIGDLGRRVGDDDGLVLLGYYWGIIWCFSFRKTGYGLGMDWVCSCMGRVVLYVLCWYFMECFCFSCCSPFVVLRTLFLPSFYLN